MIIAGGKMLQFRVNFWDIFKDFFLLFLLPHLKKYLVTSL